MMSILPGKSFPLGATVRPDGVNFVVFSKNCTRIELLLFDDANDSQPTHVLEFDPDINRTFYYWHMFVPHLQAGQLYGYRVYGEHKPEVGFRFDGSKLLIDPYAKAVVQPEGFSRAAACWPGDNTAQAVKSAVVDTSQYDWEDDQPLKHPYAKTIIYEMHVGGFTRHPSSDVDADIRGTYLGVIEKIPYLVDLGITAVELLPVFYFDEQEAPEGLTNYWGYAPISLFAPHVGYASRRDVMGPLDEFRDMVKELHKAGIEVILDVVYNHTAEGNHRGPTYSFKGFENRAYYILERNRARYANYSGTGNTLNANHSIVRRLILDSLCYWVEEMHVDGFRFDLASILSRGERGQPLGDPPVLWEIESNPILAGTKIIAEAWDAGGLYQVGSFIGHRWQEWNGRFRDDVRRFLKGDSGMAAALPARFLASPDIYAHELREPEQSINFITSHDGFTMNDLVSYNEKHNHANGEGNRDGSNNNHSWNCGVEGPTADMEIEALRNRQVKNFFTILLTSLGVPMLVMGDEVRRTQQGNNNPYCQDNAISWFDWADLEKHADIRRFVKKMIEFRQTFDRLDANHQLTLTEFLSRAQFEWHGVNLSQPDFSEHSHSLSFTIYDWGVESFLHFIFNAYWEPLEFELPQTTKPWRLLVDTYRSAPDDFYDVVDAPVAPEWSLLVQPRSSVILMTESHIL